MSTSQIDKLQQIGNLLQFYATGDAACPMRARKALALLKTIAPDTNNSPAPALTRFKVLNGEEGAEVRYHEISKGWALFLRGAFVRKYNERECNHINSALQAAGENAAFVIAIIQAAEPSSTLTADQERERVESVLESFGGYSSFNDACTAFDEWQATLKAQAAGPSLETQPIAGFKLLHDPTSEIRQNAEGFWSFYQGGFWIRLLSGFEGNFINSAIHATNERMAGTSAIGQSADAIPRGSIASFKLLRDATGEIWFDQDSQFWTLFRRGARIRYLSFFERNIVDGAIQATLESAGPAAGNRWDRETSLMLEACQKEWDKFRERCP